MRFALLFLATLLFAQPPSASLSGSIVDQLGGAVIAAKLELRGNGSQLYRGKSSEQGTFRFGRMEAATYTLAIDQAGFCKLEIPAIAVSSGEQKTLPQIVLKSECQ